MKKKIISIIVFLFLVALAGFVFYAQKNELFISKYDKVGKLRAQALKNSPETEKNVRNGIEQDLKELAEDQNNLSVVLSLGTNYQILGEYSKAITYYKRAIAITDETYLGWRNLAKIYTEAEDYQNARNAYENLLKNYPDIEVYMDFSALLAAGKGGTIEDAKYVLQQGILKTGSKTLEDQLKKYQAMK